MPRWGQGAGPQSKHCGYYCRAFASCFLFTYPPTRRVPFEHSLLHHIFSSRLPMSLRTTVYTSQSSYSVALQPYQNSQRIIRCYHQSSCPVTSPQTSNYDETFEDLLLQESIMCWRLGSSEAPPSLQMKHLCNTYWFFSWPIRRSVLQLCILDLTCQRELLKWAIHEL